MDTQKKKVAIVGAGISGLTAGIYLLDNNFDVEIYEKNPLPGGECTGWYRDGVYIDGCAHWIVGTNPQSDFYPLWNHIGAIDENIKIFEADYFLKYHFKDESITIYSNLDKLYEELIRISPEDQKVIKEICKRIQDYQYVRVPVKKPIDMMNIFELIEQGFKMLPLLYSYVYSRKEPLASLGAKFKNEKLKIIFEDIFAFPRYNSHSFYYTMGMLSKNDAGMVEGGSLNFARRIADKFKEKGGKLFLNAPVEKVIIENDIAKGIKLEKGDIINCDYVVSSTDINHTFDKLIGHKYITKSYQKMFDQKDDYPLSNGFLLSYKVDGDVLNYDKTEFYKIEPFKIVNEEVSIIRVRSHAFDKTLNKKDYTITVMINANYEIYDYLKKLNKEDYLSFKKELGDHVRKELINLNKQYQEDNIKLIDVATPLTYERYMNAYKGSYMSFITTKNSKGLFQPNYLKNLKNFVLAGQWLMPPGGLPPAVLTGKYVAIRIAKLNHQKFINKENKKAKFYTCKRKHNS